MKSGNGTAAPQWLYILGNFPRFWVVKIGIAGNLLKRERQVDKSAPGWDGILFALWFPFAYHTEQWIHRKCEPLRVHFTGSGHTERFLFPAAFLAIPVALVVFLATWGSMALVALAVIKTML